MGNDLVLRDLVDGVAVLSLNRPTRHNALSDAAADAWRAAVAWAISEPAARCILFRGEGRSFCSGRDTAELGQRANGETDYEYVRRAQETRLATLDAPKLVVAAVRGHALGGGFEVALSADMRVAATDAVFGFPEIEFGLVADTGGTQLLTALAGPARAKWLLASGERIGAEQALAWGIVDWVVPGEALDDRALEICRSLAAAPPTAAVAVKQLVDQAWAKTIRAGMRQELLAQTALFAGDEHRQAKAARAAGR